MPIRKYKYGGFCLTHRAPKDRGHNTHEIGKTLGADALMMCDRLTNGKYYNRDYENKWRSRVNKK